MSGVRVVHMVVIWNTCRNGLLKVENVQLAVVTPVNMHDENP